MSLISYLFVFNRQIMYGMGDPPVSPLLLSLLGTYLSCSQCLSSETAPELMEEAAKFSVLVSVQKPISLNLPAV